MFPTNLKRLVVCQGVVDFRKQWNGLLDESERLGFNPFEGDLIAFVKRDKRQLRAICGDDKGLYLFSRRFEGGCFWFEFSQGAESISRKDLTRWFEGSQLITKDVSSWR